MKVRSTARGIITRNIQKGKNPQQNRLAKMRAKQCGLKKIKSSRMTLKFV